MFHRAHFCKSAGFVFVLGAVVLPCAQAGSTSTQDPAPALKIGAPAPRSDFYVKVDSGAVFFRPPDKDNGNFSDAINPNGVTSGVTSLGSQSGDDVTWSLGGTVGFYLPGQPTEAWMGKNLRVEAFGNYFSTSHAENSGVSVSGGGDFVTVGRLDGNYTGTNESTDIGSLTAGPNPVAGETLTTRDEYYQAGAAIRTDYLFNHGSIVLSPRIGFQYFHLGQDFHTSANGNRGSVDQEETVDTDYFGPKFDLELKVQLTKNLVCFAEGGISPLYTSSDYSGTQFGTSTRFGGGALQNSASDSQNSFAFNADLMTGIYCDFGPVVLKLGGGFEYWNYVATVQEASIPAGTDTFGGAPAPYTIQPSHLGSSDMLNPAVKMSVILPF